MPGVVVDLDHGDVRAERERRVTLVEVELRGEPGRAVGVIDDVVGAARGGGGERRPSRAPWPGTPATPTVPVPVSTTMSATSASSRCAARRRAFSTSASVASMHGRAAELQRPRTAGAAAAADEVGVALHEADPLDRDAGLVADDHRERGLVALSVRGRAGPHRGRAVVVDLDGAELAGCRRRR